MIKVKKLKQGKGAQVKAPTNIAGKGR